MTSLELDGFTLSVPELYSTENTPCEDKEVVFKFESPNLIGWDWQVVEGEELPDGDWRFFGLVNGFDSEWGYFLLSELNSVGVFVVK